MHDCYVDLSKSEDITSLTDSAITEAELIIGNDTGLVGLTQMITSALTIMIDTPDIKPHPPWSNLVSVPRKFVIDNHRKAFTCDNPEDLYKKIFSSSALWTEEFELSQASKRGEILLMRSNKHAMRFYYIEITCISLNH